MPPETGVQRRAPAGVPTKVSKPCFGFIKFSECYHSTDKCPVVKNAKRASLIEIRQYENEDEAFQSGHHRRCKLCMGDVVLFPEGRGGENVRLSKEQYEALSFIVKSFRKSGAMNLKSVADARKKSVVATHLVIRKLITKGLVKHEVEIGHRKAKDGSIAPTDKGQRAYDSEAEY